MDIACREHDIMPGLLPHFVLAVLVCAALAVGPGPTARAADPISEEEAHSIGVPVFLPAGDDGHHAQAVDQRRQA